MKIALCLSGLAHNLDHYYPITKSGILDKFQCDTFVAIWENDYTGCWDSEHEKAIELYKPVLYHTEYQKLIGDPPRTELTDKFMSEYPRKDRWANFRKGYPEEKKFKTGWGRQNVLNLFYQIWKCNELKKIQECRMNKTYDVVIRARVDRGWEINHKLRQKKNTIFFHNLKDANCLSDWGAYGSSEDMDKYVVWPNIVKIAEQQEQWTITEETHKGAWYHWLDPHRTLRQHLENEDLEWELIDRPLFRGHGIAFNKPLP